MTDSMLKTPDERAVYLAAFVNAARPVSNRMAYAQAALCDFRLAHPNGLPDPVLIDVMKALTGKSQIEHWKERDDRIRAEEREATIERCARALELEPHSRHFAPRIRALKTEKDDG